MLLPWQGVLVKAKDIESLVNLMDTNLTLLEERRNEPDCASGKFENEYIDRRKNSRRSTKIKRGLYEIIYRTFDKDRPCASLTSEDGTALL